MKKKRRSRTNRDQSLETIDDAQLEQVHGGDSWHGGKAVKIGKGGHIGGR